MSILKMQPPGNSGDQKPKLPSFNQLISDFDYRRPRLRLPPQDLNEEILSQLRPPFQVHQQPLHVPKPTQQEQNETGPDFDPRRSYTFPAARSPLSKQVSQQHQRRVSTLSSNEGPFVSDEYLQPTTRTSVVSLPQYIHHQSAPSLQAFPPIGGEHHRKASSLQSISSLQSMTGTVSNLGSPTRENKDREIEMLYQIEKMLYSSRLVLSVAEDIKSDLINHLSRNNQVLDEVKLLSNYTGDQESKMSNSAVEHFVNNVPVELLTSAISEVNVISDSLQRWRAFRTKHEEEIGVRTVPTTPIRTKRKSVVDASPMKSLKKTPKAQQESIFVRMDQNSTISSSPSSSLQIRQTNPKQIKPRSRAKPKQLGLNEELSAQKKLVCVQCGETDTPEWRRGPYGVRTLCNACGLFHGKLIKKLGVQLAAQIMLQRRTKGQGSDRRIPNEEEN